MSSREDGSGHGAVLQGHQNGALTRAPPVGYTGGSEGDGGHDGEDLRGGAARLVGGKGHRGAEQSTARGEKNRGLTVSVLERPEEAEEQRRRRIRRRSLGGGRRKRRRG